MLIQWMAYATLIAAFAYAGALAVERVAAIWNIGQRFVWLTALCLASLTPILLATRPVEQTSAAGATAGAGATASRRVVVFSTAATSSAPSSLEKLESRAANLLPGLDPVVRGLWFAASVAWLGLLVRAAVMVRRQRSGWRAVVLDGADVLVAPNLGPAVVGALKPRVIIPEWALSLNPEARALMLRHESEHIRARDPLMLFGGVLLVALFPWNPALWMVVRRLRLAIEIDCDQRVLRSSHRQREYGILLLTVGARHAAPMPFATSLAERRPFLERRIRAMTNTRPRNPRLMSVACVAAAMLVLTAAVRAPRPQSLGAQVSPAVATPVRSATPAPATAAAATPATRSVEPTPARATSVAASPAAIAPPPARAAASVPSASAAMPQPARASTAPAASVPPMAKRSGGLTEQEIRALIALHYPSVLKGDPNINLLTFVIDAHGNYVASSSAYQPPPSQAEKEREEVLAAKLAAEAGMRGRGGRGSVTVQGYAITADSAKRAEEMRVMRNQLIERIAGDTVAVASSFQGRISGAVMAGSDTVIGIGDQQTSFLSGLNINSNDIDNVEILKTTGKFSPLYLGVIVIQLK